VYAGKPIIGIAGGIGSGKSFVASLFAELGGLVIDSDEMVRRAYQDPQVRQQLKQWWGDEVFHPHGEVDRRAIARRVFDRPEERKRLEHLIHPMVNDERARVMEEAAHDPQVLAFVWDTPLLFETGLNQQCDAVVFVDAPHEVRLQRVSRRGWDDQELARREKSQWPLDKKREISDYVIKNTAAADSAVVDETRGQVKDVLSRIFAGTSRKPVAPG
jgi:dephospho-CoA kinase